MVNVFKAAYSALSQTLLTVYLAVRVVLDVVGYTATPSDFAELPKSLRTALDLWVLLPGWVNWGLLGVLILLFAWSHWPDVSRTSELKKIRAEFKKSNNKAWDFSGKHGEVVDALTQIRSEITAIRDTLDEQSNSNDNRFDNLEAKFVGAIGSIRDNKGSADSGLEAADRRTDEVLAELRNLGTRLGPLLGNPEGPDYYLRVFFELQSGHLQSKFGRQQSLLCERMDEIESQLRRVEPKIKDEDQ
jgi:hypothetical protein